MNRWNIPPALEQEVLARDTKCIYCAVQFARDASPEGARPSWEHIVNDSRIVTRENIARCCRSCNSSKGTKSLLDWLASAYCRRKGITEGTVAQVVRDALSAQGRAS
jgi:hypothetical protein